MSSEIVKRADSPYIQAFNSQSLAECKKPLALTSILGSLMKAMEIAAVRTSKEQLNEQEAVCKRLAGLFYEHALIKYPYVRLAQIDIAFKNGVLKEYGDYFGFSIQTLHLWVKSFLKSKENALAVIEHNKIVDTNLKSEVPVYLKLKKSKEALMHRFEEYKQTGKIGYFAWAVYDIINDMIGVEFTDGKKKFKTLITDPVIRKEIFDSTKEEIIRKFSAEKKRLEKRGDFNQAKNIGEFLAQLDSDQVFYNRCKEKLLKAFFNQLINEHKNLNL